MTSTLIVPIIGKQVKHLLRPCSTDFDAKNLKCISMVGICICVPDFQIAKGSDEF